MCDGAANVGTARRGRTGGARCMLENGHLVVVLVLRVGPEQVLKHPEQRCICMESACV